MEIRKYFEIIWKRKWVLISSFCIIVILVVIATNVLTPIYEAKTKVLIEQSSALSAIMSSLNVPTNPLLTPNLTNIAYGYDTEITLVKISPILQKLIANLNLKDRKGETLKPEKVPFSITRLILPQPYIAVDQYLSSNILEITGGSTNPAEAAKISNELAKLYIDNTVGEVKKSFRAARLFIENQMEDVKKKYFKSLLERKNFMTEESTVDLTREISELLDTITKLKQGYNDNEATIAQAEESISLIEKQIAGKEHISSNLINTMESKLNDLLINISGKKIELTEKHPDIVILNKQIDTIKKQLEEKMEIAFSEKAVSMAPVYEELIRNLKDAYINKKTGEIKRELLKQFIDKYQDELMKIPPKIMRSSAIDVSLNANQDTYKNLLTSLNQLGVAESITLANIRLVEPAVEPESDALYFPKKNLSYVLGIFLSLFCGLFLTFFIEYIDNKIRSPEDIKQYGFTFLGSIPKFKWFKGKPMVSKLNPNDPIYEAYRKILTNIDFVTLDKPYNNLLVSGINPKEGSSTTAMNLGIILASEGKKVLLVDADLRKPNLHRLFGLPNTKGFIDLLFGNAEMEKVIQPSKIDGLSIIPTGPATPDPGLLIKSNKMREVIRGLKGKFDIILFRSAPLLIRNDAVLLMRNLDAMIIVSRNGVTNHPSIARTDELLKNSKITPIGIILNRV
ncbi:MAG: hypothetical protein A2Y97_04040 [Nitrospirae bacterium RBG_13_39_12]|nr:MAG: hypothetical protein A2Y97_04040 [Nitrospirae bacterium RBG_13_39_12]